MRFLSIISAAFAIMLTMSFGATAQELDLKANMDSPGGFCSSNNSGDRTVWVLSDKPMKLALLGNSQQGNELSCAQLTGWEKTSKGYMTQIAFPSSYVSQYPRLRLVREDGKGWSDWNKDHGSNEMAFLRNSNVGKGDPACVGSRAWCATRGL